MTYGPSGTPGNSSHPLPSYSPGKLCNAAPVPTSTAHVIPSSVGSYERVESEPSAATNVTTVLRRTPTKGGSPVESAPVTGSVSLPASVPEPLPEPSGRSLQP